MTVHELIQKLHAFPPDAVVLMDAHSNDLNHVEYDNTGEEVWELQTARIGRNVRLHVWREHPPRWVPLAVVLQ